ncbi:hypothetical protein BAC1_00853 [uncultured bacterium]|nr:hypothetical protein BAC1_00853 [uncultured bacterium]
MGNIKACDDMFFTITMAEVLEEQGHYEDALMIYKILVDTNPWDQSLGMRIDKLKSLAEKGRRRPQKQDTVA